MQQTREEGCGKLRLGTIFNLNEGIYSVLYIANLRREYLKLSLYNTKVNLDLEIYQQDATRVQGAQPNQSAAPANEPQLRERVLIGHRKAYKGVTQSINEKEGFTMTTQFVYIDQEVNEDFSLFNVWKENGETKRLE